ncbi:amidohydrolase family protein [Streptomyces sp. NPDC001292]|uniref:amidohydrolase family protein n=1 Tax=Streptomyces sp. NPDC001292 TaxID=3364558 RepID=UPI0036947715
MIDADGLIVAPGVVDAHTHYDAQVSWDPYCTISGWHGVTSVVIGNCFASCRWPMLSMTRRPGAECHPGGGPRFPAAITRDMGFCPSSTAGCSLVVSPPRERPSPWSAGSAWTPPDGSFCSSPFPAPRRRAGAPGTPWSPR